MNGKPIDLALETQARHRAASDPERTPRRVAEGVPLGKLIKRTLVKAPELVLQTDSRSIYAEKYRRLKTTLTNLAGRPRVVLISSGAPSEGKTITAMNLALAFANDSDEKTLLVDADLRRPSLGAWVQPAPKVGLSHLLGGEATLEHAIVPLEGTPLHLLPAGEPHRDPLELIGSSRTKELMLSLRERYDRIVIDTSPLIPFTDADALGVHGDGIVLVVRAGETAVSTYRQTLAAVTSTQILGVVLNDVSRASLADWGKYHGASPERRLYSYYYEKGRRK
jgi:capsular exopolysaccharide synthesis family protein